MPVDAAGWSPAESAPSGRRGGLNERNELGGDEISTRLHQPRPQKFAERLRTASTPCVRRSTGVCWRRSVCAFERVDGERSSLRFTERSISLHFAHHATASTASMGRGELVAAAPSVAVCLAQVAAATDAWRARFDASGTGELPWPRGDSAAAPREPREKRESRERERARVRSRSRFEPHLKFWRVSTR
jgi:hypothetical protein